MRFRVPNRTYFAAGLIAAFAFGCSGAESPGLRDVRATTDVPTAAISSPAEPVQSARLRDFSALVLEVGAAVVNIRTVRSTAAGARGTPPIPEDDPFYEFFRRFGGPSREGVPQPAQGLGSGFILTADGYILTNAHVVADAIEIAVRLTDRREFSAKVIGTDRRTDVAVLKIDASDLPAVRIGDYDRVRVGEWVAAIGSPFGFENSVTSGIVSAKGRSLSGESYVPFIQTDVPVNPGNSGGPLFNMRGEVIGINSAIYSRTGGYMGLSFAIPIDVAMQVKNDLVQYGKVRRGRLGVTIQSVNQALAQSFGLEKPAGAIVSSVESGGPADKAGVLPGDIILRLGGKTVDEFNELPAMVAALRPGTKTEIEIWRKGKRTALPATIGEMPDDTIASAEPVLTPAGRLGLAVRPLTPEERRQAGIEGGEGLLVERAEGPAARAGIRVGDVILDVDGVRIRDIEQLRKAVSMDRKVVALLVQRDNTRIYIPVTIG
jgi:serine protease Do